MTTIRTRAAKGSALSATEYDDAVKRTPVAKSSNYTLDASHNREVHELGGSITTVTLPIVSSSFTETDDWFITLINTLNTTITIGRNGQTIDGASSDLTLNGKEKITIWMNSTFDGFYTNRELWTPYYGCLAYHSASQTHNSSGNWVDLYLDTNSYDSGSIHVPASSQVLFNAPAWATKARVNVFLTFFGDTTGVRRVRFVTSAGASITPSVQVGRVVAGQEGSYNTELNLSSGIIPVTGGSSYKFQSFQDSGGNLSISAGVSAFVEFFP